MGKSISGDAIYYSKRNLKKELKRKRNSPKEFKPYYWDLQKLMTDQGRTFAVKANLDLACIEGVLEQILETDKIALHEYYPLDTPEEERQHRKTFTEYDVKEYVKNKNNTGGFHSNVAKITTIPSSKTEMNAFNAVQIEIYLDNILQNQENKNSIKTRPTKTSVQNTLKNLGLINYHNQWSYKIRITREPNFR